MMIEIRGVGFSNKGSELMLGAIVQYLRHVVENVNFAAVPEVGSYQQRLQYGLYQKVSGLGRVRFRYLVQSPVLIDLLLPRQFRKAFGMVTENDVDVLLDASGFAYGDQWGPQKTEQMATLATRLKKKGKKVILLPQALGPFESARIRQAFQQILNCADAVYARDRASYEYAEGVGGSRSTLMLAPDFTVLLEAQVPDYFRPDGKHACIVPNMKMITKSWQENPDAYLLFLVFCVRHLLRKGIPSSLLLHETHRDEELVSRLLSECGPSLHIIRERDPVYAKGVLGSCSLVIGSRYHALVGALSQGVPCIGTGWSHKYRELFENYSCGEYLIEALDDLDEVASKLDQLSSDQGHSDLVDKLEEKSQAHKAKTREMWNQIQELLGDSIGG